MKELGNLRVLGLDLSTTRCGGVLRDNETPTRFRLDIDSLLRPLDRNLEVLKWVESLLDDYSPEFVAIETFGEFGPSQSTMAAVIGPVEVAIRRRRISLLRIPPADLTYFIAGEKKVGKGERVRLSKEEGFGKDYAGDGRISHDEADAFFVCKAGYMVLEWIKKGHRDVDYPMHQRYILFSHKQVKHGLRGLAHNPGRYLYLGPDHKTPPKGTV